MKLSRAVRLLIALIALILVVAACDDSGTELTTTSTVVTEDSEPVATTTVPEPAPTTVPEVTLVGESVDSYEIVGRETTDNGEVLYIVIPQGAYTDIDMENFVGNLIENEIVTWGAEVFDDATAVDAFLKEESERTEEEQELLDQHHFLSVISGNTIRFQGPFEESGEMVIGS